MFRFLLAGLLAIGCAVHPSAAQERAETPTDTELRTLRQGLIDAVNASDVDKLLSYLHEDVIVTWLDGTQSRGHEQVRAYYRSKTEGEDALVESFSVEPETKELSFLYGGDTAVAYGDAISYFDLKDGRQLSVNGPWTATMVKDAGRWRIAAFHSSTGLFDNPLLSALRQFALWGIGIAGVVGLLLGIVAMVILRKFRKPRTVASA